MSLKKNYLAIVVGGLVLVTGTMVYLKVTYNSNQESSLGANLTATSSSVLASNTKDSSASNIGTNLSNGTNGTNGTNASSAIVQEVLASSTVEAQAEIKEKQSQEVLSVPPDVSITPSAMTAPNIVTEEMKKEEEARAKETQKLHNENKLLEEKLKEAKIQSEALKKEQAEKTQKLQEEAKKRKEESDKLKAETEELRKALSLKSAKNNNDTGAKICISYGPMTIDLKNRFKNILNNNKVAANVYQDRQLPQYEIFWNLGNNKLEALERFEKQKKEGALRDEKFKLTQDNSNNWIVPATTIAGDYAVAETLAKQLSASSSKFGGKWDIREKTGGHYIIFQNVNLISDTILLTIDKDLRLNKTFC